MFKKLIKILFYSLLVIVAATFVFGYAGDTDIAEMEAKYGNSPVLRTQASGIRYRDSGIPGGPTLLLLHGSNSSLDTWEPMVELLADRFRLIRYDQFGHGMTGAHEQHDYSAAARVAAGVEVLDELGVESAIWVGNSMGGGVAWRAAMLAPERVNGLVLLNASGAQTDEPVTPYLGAAVARTWLGRTILPLITPRFMVATSLEQSVADPSMMTDALVDRYWEMVRYPGNRDAMAASIVAGRESELWNTIDSINIPTFIVWGEQDSVVPVAHAHAFAEQIPNSSKIIYPHLGHLPMEEEPASVAKDISAWFDSAYSTDNPESSEN